VRSVDDFDDDWISEGICGKPIRARLGGRVITGALATEAAVKSMNAAGDLARYETLVFATHGLVAGQAGAASPGLVLTPPDRASALDDGLLPAAEIATFDLAARLVVLSACNTAAGETGAAEGLSGLARAFFHAGAENVLVTQWSVYSDAAVDLSTGLFAALAEDVTITRAEALRRATLALLDDPASDAFQRHPSYWAAFSLIGAT